MAVGKYSRQEKRMPSFYIMVSSLMFIAFCLVAMWVFGSPMKGEVDPNRITPSDSKGLMTKSQNENMSLDESTGESLQDNDENLDDAIPDENRVTRSVSLTSDNSKNDQPGVDKDEGSLLDELKGKDKADDEEAAEKGDEDGLVNVSGEPEKRESEGATTAKEEKLADSSDGGEQLETQVGNTEDAGSWDTQVSESREEKEIIKKNDLKKQKEEAARPLKEVTDSLKNLEEGEDLKQVDGGQSSLDENESEWSICNGTDYIPCLDNLEAIKKLHSTKHYQHRERHCPEERPLCLVPIPEGYEDHSNFPWPQSRDQISYKNVPHLGLVSYKKDQNWVKRKGDRLVFPGGGTQFKHGALHYIDFVEKVLPDIAWGKHTRVILDVGCGVASFGGYLFDKDVLTMSFAPKDEHEAQVQFALERGIPAISAVMGTQRLVFPSNVYDAVHCARCRVPWHIEGGKLLLELNRVLRPGGVFIWSATPVYWKGEEDVSIWKEMVSLTASMCWNLLTRTTDVTTGVGVAIFKKPITNNCYEHRKQNKPPICEKEDKPDAAWYVNMTACIHKVPSEKGVRGIEWPVNWPQRLTVAPSWLSDKELSNGKSAAAAFASDTANWQKQVQGNYFQVGIDWSKIRNVMDMRAVYGGFAAALATQQVWVVNVVPVDAPDTLPVIFDRGLFGIYHDWCESFSTYPRTYDLLHADYLFTKLRKRCGEIRGIIVEVDRILRPMGWFIVRDESDNLQEIKVILKSLHWDVADTKHDGLLVAQKKMWRPMAAF